MLRYFLIFLIIFTYYSAYSQPGGNPYTARMVITRGGYVEFMFNSLEKYENGITFTDYTYIDICFQDPDNPGAGGTKWKLEVMANSASFVGASALPLNMLELDISGTPTAIYPATPVAISAVNQVIASDGLQGNESDNRIKISYQCGVSVNLMGKASGYNTVDLIFTLSAQP